MYIYILDDDPDVICAITAMVEALGHDVTSFTSPKVFLENISRMEMGCIILDYYMPDMNGLEVQKSLLKLRSMHPILLLTGVGNIPEAMAATRAGAVDCLRKPPTLAALKAALGRAEEQLSEARKLRTFGSLSGREREVLRAIGLGKSSKIIAYDLGISIRTVDMHRGNLLNKLNASNAGEAVFLAQKHNLI